MTAPSRTKRPGGKRSAYPADLATLVEQARALADTVGRTPSQRQVREALHIGQPRARQVLAELARGRLHLVDQPDGPDAAPASNPAPEPSPEPKPEPTSEPAAEPVSAPPEPAVEPAPEPAAEPASESVAAPASVRAPTEQTVADPQVWLPAEPAPEPDPEVKSRRKPVWPVVLVALAAFVTIWSGWVGLGGMTGFGIVHPLPGIWDSFQLNTAITLPIGMEAYAAYALRVWVSQSMPARARRFARVSTIAALTVGALGQVTYHLLTAAHVSAAPWPITMLVSCLPIAVLGMAAALAHLVRTD
jgi:hypothetical protein